MTVTVLVSFNRAAFVVRTVRSLLEQTQSGVEVVVLDLGTDDTAARVRQAYGTAVEIVSAPGASVPRARNVALALSTAPYVALASADTPSAADRIARQLAALEADPSAGLCHTDVSFVDEDGAPAVLPPARLPQPSGPRAGWLAPTLLLGGNPVFGATVMLRRSVLDEVGLFDETPGLGWDFDLWVRLATRATFVHVPSPLVQYRARTFAIPDDGPSHATRRHLAAFTRRARDTAPAVGIPAAALAHRRHALLLELAYQCLDEGDARGARAALREALLLGPPTPRALALLAAAVTPRVWRDRLRAVWRAVH
jgi:teichuronic acid biosynthesis glycosyltransferase TuaG